jgi:hypothetical protein
MNPVRLLAVPAVFGLFWAQSVSAIDAVRITNTVANPVPVAGTVGIAGTPSVSVGNTVSVTGGVNITNTVPVTGTVNVGTLPPVTGTVNIGTMPPVSVSATVIDTAKTAFITNSVFAIAAPNTASAILFGPDQVPAGARLVLENVSYNCFSSQSVVSPVYLTIYYWNAPVGQKPVSGLLNLPIASPIADGNGNGITTGNWTGRIYADHQTDHTWDLQGVLQAPANGGQVNCSLTVSGYTVPYP